VDSLFGGGGERRILAPLRGKRGKEGRGESHRFLSLVGDEKKGKDQRRGRDENSRLERKTKAVRGEVSLSSFDQGGGIQVCVEEKDPGLRIIASRPEKKRRSGGTGRRKGFCTSRSGLGSKKKGEKTFVCGGGREKGRESPSSLPSSGKGRAKASL